jgi:hypothetical protein
MLVREIVYFEEINMLFFKLIMYWMGFIVEQRIHKLEQTLNLFIYLEDRVSLRSLG